MAAISQPTQDAITKALADRDTAAQADSLVTQADASLAAAAQSDAEAKDAALAAHKQSGDSAHSALAALATELGINLGQ